MEDIRGAFFDAQFADEDYWPGPEHERTITSWERFKQIVEHERRYTFWSLDNDPDLGLAEIPPNEMLKAIVATVNDVNLIREQSVGSAFWRGRVHSQE